MRHRLCNQYMRIVRTLQKPSSCYRQLVRNIGKSLSFRVGTRENLRYPAGQVDCFRQRQTLIKISVLSGCFQSRKLFSFNPLNAELNPICHLLALLGAHHILHFSRIRVNPQEPGVLYIGRAYRYFPDVAFYIFF